MKTAGRDAGSDAVETGNAGGEGLEKTLLLFASPMRGADAPWCPWVEEIDHAKPLWMHPSGARELGCAEGDWVRVRGPAGEVRTRVRLTQGLHPDAVAMQGAVAGIDRPDTPRGSGTEPSINGPDRVWWKDEVYGENARKVVPWPRDPGREAPGWEDTRVTILRGRG